MTLYAILYASDALVSPTADDLAVLLARARQHNEEWGVTGHLTYIGRGGVPYEHGGRHPGHFVQWLEGEADVVRSLYRQIRDDRRHRVRGVAYAGPLRERLFPTWTMAFRRADYNPAAVELELTRLLELVEQEEGSGRTAGGPLPPAPSL